MSKLWLPGRHAAERLGLDRRAFLSAGLAAGAGVLTTVTLAGCNSQGPKSARGLLAGAQPAGARFPSYFVADEVPVWDEAAQGVWHLEISGLVRQPLRLTLAALQQLPRTELRLEHFCVEGWSAVAVRTGVLLRELASRAGVLPDARYVDFQSFDDDYHESWDLDSALHAQTLIVYGQDGRLLDAAFGAPARVYSPVKLGYKCTKYLTRIVFLAERNGGYWSDQGYEWYGGV